MQDFFANLATDSYSNPLYFTTFKVFQRFQQVTQV